MFIELADGSLVNLNQACKISVVTNQVIAEYTETSIVLYEGSPSECQAVLDKLKSRLPTYAGDVERMYDKLGDLVAETQAFIDKVKKANETKTEP